MIQGLLTAILIQIHELGSRCESTLAAVNNHHLMSVLKTGDKTGLLETFPSYRENEPASSRISGLIWLYLQSSRPAFRIRILSELFMLMMGEHFRDTSDEIQLLRSILPSYQSLSDLDAARLNLAREQLESDRSHFNLEIDPADAVAYYYIGLLGNKSDHSLLGIVQLNKGPKTKHLISWAREMLSARIERRPPNYDPINRRSPLRLEFETWINSRCDIKTIVDRLYIQRGFYTPSEIDFFIQLAFQSNRTDLALEMADLFGSSNIPSDVRQRILEDSRLQIKAAPDPRSARLLGKYGFFADIPLLEWLLTPQTSSAIRAEISHSIHLILLREGETLFK